MKIIDFRLRPPIKGFLNTRLYARPDLRDRNTRLIGFEPAPSAAQKSMDLLFKEIDAAGINRAVLVGRNTTTFGAVNNSDVAEIARLYPDRFIAVASVEASNRKDAMRQIEEARGLGMRMINLEPGALAMPLHVDDRRIYPIYAYCEDNKIPVIIMSGGSPGPDISYTEPAHLDRVLADFPEMTVIASHGNWPWVQEVIHIAYRRANLHLSPDMYLHNLPGMSDYLNAANTFLADRFLFATAYPLCPVKEYTDWFLKLPLKPDVMEKALYKNAARLLNISL
ncbi:MAG: amidohydrolase [Betaproteobacteria bacterium RIFCSPLOWO2_12_FULL_65_14]|nr:MAG: amidohydrolase [Betaproteobacteria bacterium RIFCSPLOWO2_12_FULL_65_14]